MFFFDVAFSSTVAWTGVACTNSTGSLVHAWTSKLDATDPLQGEAAAVLKAIEYASNLGLNTLVLLCDSMDAVEALQSSETTIPSLLTFTSITSEASLFFDSWEA
ncbi:hypothetical protein CDL15_Pgr013911 [Punica granatum]|uniref:RNase H type-1 domain-containing protein n=1 Tax=Punica granatum TaxID=22663 RepID=A0A218WAT3_PUNGR|nr:hypothetical protein CDL15_Pgr013911 [Punica granatum]